MSDTVIVCSTRRAADAAAAVLGIDGLGVGDAVVGRRWKMILVATCGHSESLLESGAIQQWFDEVLALAATRDGKIIWLAESH